jgi:hypothetical protein
MHGGSPSAADADDLDTVPCEPMLVGEEVGGVRVPAERDRRRVLEQQKQARMVAARDLFGDLLLQGERPAVGNGSEDHGAGKHQTGRSIPGPGS